MKHSSNPSPAGGKITHPQVPNVSGPARGSSPKPQASGAFNAKHGQSAGTGVLKKQRKGYGEQTGRGYPDSYPAQRKPGTTPKP